MPSIKDCRLYVITGENYHPGRRLTDVMEEAIRGGADIIQLRDKTAPMPDLIAKAHVLRDITWKHNVLFIVNDVVEVALQSDADGVHLGQEDTDITAARERMGSGRLIGISTHEIGHARAAERSGADYIGVGPVYPTGTKPGRKAVTTAYVDEVAKEIAIPWFAIGGINAGTADEVLAAGAERLCAVSAVVGDPDPAAVCRMLRERIYARLDGKAPVTGLVSSGKRLIVNGREERTAMQTLEELADHHQLGRRRVIAERNGIVVPRADWGITALEPDDCIEFVHFVGGG